MVVHTNSIVIDRFILCCCLIVTLDSDPGSSTEPTGHFQLLPCEHLSDSRRPQSNQYLRFPPCFPTPIFPTDPRGLGERTLVPELGNQSYLCFACDISAAMGTKVSQGHPVALQSAQALTVSCLPCRRSRKTSPSVDSQSFAYTSPHFPLPVLRRSGCFPIEHQSHSFQIGAVVG